MSASDRIRRPPLDRTEPIRAWSSLFGAGPLNDVVTRSVELGYRVVDEYIRQGQKAAARFGSPSLGTETMASDMQDLGVRMVQYTSDVFGLWFEMMNVMLAGGSPFRPARAARGAVSTARRNPASTAWRKPASNARRSSASVARRDASGTGQRLGGRIPVGHRVAAGAWPLY